jgi:hypothetical protein
MMVTARSHLAEAVVDRVAVMLAQGISYDLGRQEILRLRERARNALGAYLQPPHGRNTHVLDPLGRPRRPRHQNVRLNSALQSSNAAPRKLSNTVYTSAGARSVASRFTMTATPSR